MQQQKALMMLMQPNVKRCQCGRNNNTNTADLAEGTVVDAKPNVLNHNIETVRRLSPAIRPQADYDRSLNVLRNLKKMASSALIKSGIMVGLGESREEVVGTMQDLADAGCDMLTIGQYLAPTKEARHLRVERFVTPEEFTHYWTI